MNALEINSLSKQYADFTLDHLSFSVPRGSIVGFIGENGAGKSTTIKAILGLIAKDGGSVSLLGKKENEIRAEVREQIGVVFDGENFPENMTLKKLQKLMGYIYPTWDQKYFYFLLKKLSLPIDKKVKKLSKGMKMKAAIAAALAHHPKLLILDEPTAGLDPIMRDDILDLFLDFVQDDGNSILVSSHITSDLEKVADYIVFINGGKIIFEKPKDELIYEYGVIKCGEALFNRIDQKDIIAYRKQDYERQVLIADRKSAAEKYPDAVIDPSTIDEIMLLYIKGERVK